MSVLLDEETGGSVAAQLGDLVLKSADAPVEVLDEFSRGIGRPPILGGQYGVDFILGDRPARTLSGATA
jgi:hypothetical protein